KLGNATAGKPAPLGHERTRSREPTRAAELSRGMAHRLADFLTANCLVNPARAATGSLTVRVGFPSRNGPEPNRGLVAETSCPALYQCDPADVRADRCHDHNYCFCYSPAGKTNARTGAKRANRLARHSCSNRIAHAQLSRSSRSVAAHR